MHIIDLSSIKTSCGNCNLAELCLPRGLEPADLEQLDRIGRRSRPIHKGDCPFHRNERMASLYAVRSGSIKVYTQTETGDEQVVGFYLPGEILGLDGVATGVHTCTAVALETSSLCAFSFSNLADICKEIPALQQQMFRIMGREISQDNELLLTINHKNAEERIATFLLSLSNRFQRLGYSPVKFKLSMSRREIGNYLGLTIETVSRVFSRFKQEGLIEANRRFVEISDLPALTRLCTGSVPARQRGGRVA